MRIDNEVLAVLSKAEINGAAVALTGQLDRKLYERTNKALEAAGGKWNRKAKAHVFDADASERIEQMIATGDIVVPKDEFNFFPTPVVIVDEMLSMASIGAGMRVLEPSAGKGAIAIPCAELGADVDCVELLDANFAALQDDARLRKVVHTDFLQLEPRPIYDRVLMNPPFLKQADIKHVTHALKFLKPGGLLVSIMASSVSFRENKLTSEFRALVQESGGSIAPLPEGSFKESGTMANTVIVCIPS
jgi:predicted RNA methylase